MSDPEIIPLSERDSTAENQQQQQQQPDSHDEEAALNKLWPHVTCTLRRNRYDEFLK
ncbi:hypothetical protein M9458_007584, partial [Cirrhinus mrigala]